MFADAGKLIITAVFIMFINSIGFCPDKKFML